MFEFARVFGGGSIVRFGCVVAEVVNDAEQMVFSCVKGDGCVFGSVGGLFWIFWFFLIGVVILCAEFNLV